MYATGHIQAGQGTSQDVIDVLEGLMTTHPAWEFVEEHNSYRIWKNLGTENSWDADFYVAIRQVSSSIRFSTFENWNTSNKSLARPCVRSSTNKACGADASLDNGASFTSGVNYLGGSAMFEAPLWNDDGGGTAYWFSVTFNRIIATTRRDSSNAVQSVYVGMFDTFIPDHPNEFPLVICSPHQASTSATGYAVGAWSRHPGREGTTHRENFAIYPMLAGAASDWTKTEGSVGTTSGDLFHNNQPVGSRMLVRPLMGGGSTWGHLRGLYRNILDISAAAAVVAGDTVEIGGETWVYMGSSGNWMNASA